MVVQLKDVITTMVDKLGHFSKEVMRIPQAVGTEGSVLLQISSSSCYLLFFRKLGGQTLVLDVEGTWRELTGVGG